jgi:hypothetical protein
VAGTRDGSWDGYCLALVRLAAKLSHVGANVDGLACRLYRPPDCDYQAWVQSLLMGTILSHHIAQVSAVFDRLFEGCEGPGMGLLMQC